MTTSMTLNDYLAVLWRRRWIIIQAVVVVPTIAVFLSTRQASIYEATSQVLLSRAAANVRSHSETTGTRSRAARATPLSKHLWRASC